MLASRERLLEILKAELLEIRERFATPRRTALEEGAFEHDIEDLIQREDMVVTVTNAGYIKRVALSTYRAQHRGGKGRAGMSMRDEDFVSQVFVVNTHTPVLFFSSNGIVYKLKVYKLPLGSPQARGKAMINLLPLDQGETITTLMPLPEDEDTWGDLFVMFATASGHVRRNRLSDFVNVWANGKIAMKLDSGDSLVRVRTCAEDEDVLLSTRGGKCIRFPVTDVRVFMGRTATGVRGVRLAKDDRVISMSALRHVKAEVAERDEYLQAVNARRRLAGSDYTDRPEDRERDEALAAKLETSAFIDMAADEQFILTVTEDGFGKRSSAYDYRIAGRGGKGLDNMDLRRENGTASTVVASFPVIDTDQMVMVSDGGKIIRIPVGGVRRAGRKTRGVTVFKTAAAEHVVSVSRIREVDDDMDSEGDAAHEGDAAREGDAAQEDAGTPDGGSGSGAGPPAPPNQGRPQGEDRG